MASIGSTALKVALEKQMSDLICIKHTRLCLGKCVNQISRDLKIAYSFWTMTDQCELTDDEINCIVNELRTVCDFQITQNTDVPVIEVPLQNPTSPIDVNEGEPTEETAIVYTSATAYSNQESLEWMINIAGIGGQYVGATSLKVKSLSINNQEFVQVGSEPTIDLTFNNVADPVSGFDSGLNWIPATNALYGYTYTDFVEELNKIFTNLGISVLKAQVMTKDEGITCINYGVNHIRRKDIGGWFLLKTDDVLRYGIEVESMFDTDTFVYEIDLAYQSWYHSAPFARYSGKNYQTIYHPDFPADPINRPYADNPWKWYGSSNGTGTTCLDYIWWGTTDPIGTPWNVVNNLVIE